MGGRRSTSTSSGESRAGLCSTSAVNPEVPSSPAAKPAKPPAPAFPLPQPRHASRLPADLAPDTTWALVSSTPSDEITLALPAPSPRDVRTARLATLGSTDAATRVTTAE